MSALANWRNRIEQFLFDTGNAIWDTASIDESIDHALDEYNMICPLHMETAITLPGDGREIGLADVTGLLAVLDVWWPYSTTATAEAWPPNRVRGWRLWWDDANPVLFLEIVDSSQPQEDDELRLWYTRGHAIQDFGGAATTTMQLDHESLIMLGAAGHCAMSRTIDLIETGGTDLYQVSILGTWGERKLREYRQRLRKLERVQARRGRSWGAGSGWKLDKYDNG